MIDFVKHLFGLYLASNEEIKAGIDTYLNVFYNKDNSCFFEWELMYIISTISPTDIQN